jgi:hypothetical protein
MQISPASLLAAQQQAPAKDAPQKSVFGSFLNASPVAPKQPAFPASEPAQSATPEAQSTPGSDPSQAFRRPGSMLDIKV